MAQKAMIVSGGALRYDGSNYSCRVYASAQTDAVETMVEFQVTALAPTFAGLTKASMVAAIVAAAAALDPAVVVDEVLFPDHTIVAAA